MDYSQTFFITQSIFAVVATVFIVILTIIVIMMYAKISAIAEKFEKISQAGADATESVKNFVKETISDIKSLKNQFVVFQEIKQIGNVLKETLSRTSKETGKIKSSKKK